VRVCDAHGALDHRVSRWARNIHFSQSIELGLDARVSNLEYRLDEAGHLSPERLLCGQCPGFDTFVGSDVERAKVGRSDAMNMAAIAVLMDHLARIGIVKR
jgi:hypothetical protein